MLQSKLEDQLTAWDCHWVRGHARVIADLVGDDDERRLDGKLKKLLADHYPSDEASTPPNTCFPPERRVIVEDCIKIPAETIQILSHGPNFVFRPQLSDHMVRDVGVVVERMAFGKRWSEHIRSSKQQTKTPDDQVPANNNDDQVPVTAAQPVPDDSTAQPVPDDSAAQQLTPNHCLDDALKLRRLRRSSKQPPLLKKEEEN